MNVNKNLSFFDKNGKSRNLQKPEKDGTIETIFTDKDRNEYGT
jgi:hypothetical protein